MNCKGEKDSVPILYTDAYHHSVARHKIVVV
jgi:hypothetical protein